MSIERAYTPYFQRAWNITVDTTTAQYTLTSADTNNSLRVVFSVRKAIQLAYWEAEVVIYNMEDQAKGVLGVDTWVFGTPLNLGNVLSISAGYAKSAAGDFDPAQNEIYAGTIFQPIWTRENVVDTKITLRCLVGLMENAFNFTNFTVPSGISTYDLLVNTAKQGSIPLGEVDQSALNTQKFGRAQTVFGRPYAKFQQIANDNNAFVWIDRTTSTNNTPAYDLNLRKLEFNPTISPTVTYAPPNFAQNIAPVGNTPTGVVKRTLIGTPEQTEQGVTFRVLMDAEPKLGQVIQLAPGIAITRRPIQIGQYPGILDAQGLYIIAEIKYVGDSRGEADSWYTEITGLTYQFANTVFGLTEANRNG